MGAWIGIALFFILILVSLPGFVGEISGRLEGISLKAKVMTWIFIISVLAFPIVKEYAPQYQPIVGLPIVVGIGGFLVYRFMTGFKED